MQTHVAANVRAEIARRKGTKQEDLADLLGITRQAVSRRLLGRVDFRVAELQAIADYFGIPISTLLDDTGVVSA